MFIAYAQGHKYTLLWLATWEGLLCICKIEVKIHFFFLLYVYPIDQPSLINKESFCLAIQASRLSQVFVYECFFLIYSVLLIYLSNRHSFFTFRTLQRKVPLSGLISSVFFSPSCQCIDIPVKPSWFYLPLFLQPGLDSWETE